MTLFLVNYLNALKTRDSQLLAEAHTNIKKWFSKHSGLPSEKSLSRLFSLKEEIPLLEPAVALTLASEMQNFFQADGHEVSPFVNSERVNPEKFTRYIEKNKQLNELIQSMVTVACTEILNDEGEIKPEIMEALKLQDIAAKDKETLRDNLIYAFVDSVLLKSARASWLNSDYPKQILKKTASLHLLPTLLQVVIKQLKSHKAANKAEAETNAELLVCLQTYLKKNPNASFVMDEDFSTAKLFKALAGGILNARAEPKKNRKVLVSHLIKLFTDNEADVMATLEGNARLYSGTYIDRSVQVLTPAITQQVMKKMQEFGRPLANDFKATEFAEFIMSRVSDRAIHVSQILNDEPVVFPEQDVVPASSGESISQLQYAFKDLLQQNTETNDFIKQWVQSAFEQILDSEGDFNQASIKYVKNTYAKSLDEDSNPRNEITDRNVERVRSELLSKKMSEILVSLMQEHENQLDDKSWHEFISKLKASITPIHPTMVAALTELPLLSNQANRGNLNHTFNFVFSTLDFSTVADQLQHSNKRLAEPEPTPINQVFFPLVMRQKRVAKKDRNLVNLENFVNKVALLAGAQLFDAKGNVRKTVKQFKQDEIDIVACTESLRKVLLATIAESEIAKEFFLHETPSAALAKLTTQIAAAMSFYSDESVDAIAAILPANKKINREKFFSTMKSAMVLLDMNQIMDEAGKRIKENITPFHASSIQELEISFHKLLMVEKDNKDITENTAFKKFITTLILFAYAEVLDENGNIKLPGTHEAGDDLRALFVAAYVRKVLITIAMRWLGNENYQKDQEKLAAHALENMLTTIENALKPGIDADTLKAMQGFPLYGSDPARFVMALIISPPKTNTSILDMFAEPAGETPTARTNKPNLAANDSQSHDDLKADIDEILRLLPGVNDFFPQAPAITTLQDVVTEARKKQAVVAAAAKDVEDFLKTNQAAMDKLQQQTEASRSMLDKFGILVKAVGPNFPESGIILKKIRDNYRELSTNMATINTQYRQLIKLSTDIKDNVLTYPMSIIQMMIDKMQPRKQLITATVAKIDSNVEAIGKQVDAWISNKERLNEIKEICDSVAPDLNKLAVEIHRKKREVANAREKYLQRKDILIAMQPKNFVWDDFQVQVDRMDSVIDNMSNHMQIMQKKFDDLGKAPIEELKNFSTKALVDEISRNKAELVDNKVFVLETADDILATTNRFVEKVDKAKAIHDRIFSKFNFILMDNADFWERRIGLFGGGTPFIVNDGEHRERFFPKRAVAMMHAIKGLNPDMDADLKNRAIMEAFSNTKAGWSLGRSKKTAKFYDIVETLKKTAQRDYYSERELAKVERALDAFMQSYTKRYNLSTRYLATLFTPGVAPVSASSVYAALATKEEFPHGMLHMYEVGKKGLFVPFNQNKDQGGGTVKEPLLKTDEVEQEEKTWDQKNLFVNIRKSSS